MMKKAGDTHDWQPKALTRELRDPASPVGKFFWVHLPNIKPVRDEWNLKLVDAQTIRPNAKAGVPWGTIGTAIDYRLRYYFAATPISELVAARGAQELTGYSHHSGPLGSSPTWADILSDIASFRLPANQIRWCRCIFPFFDRVEIWLQKFQPVGHRLAPTLEETLCRFCYVLALFEEVFRDGPETNSPLFTLPRRASADDLLTLAREPWVKDLAQLSWAFQNKFYSRLQPGAASRHAVLNPTFKGSREIGGADADLIVDHCLVEFKTTIHAQLRPRWLYQLLGYVLLDYQNRYNIREVGIYLTRQSVFVRWPLGRLIATLSGRTRIELSELRDDFRKTIPT